MKMIVCGVSARACSRARACFFFTQHTHVLKAREKEGHVERWDVKGRQRGRGNSTCILPVAVFPS